MTVKDGLYAKESKQIKLRMGAVGFVTVLYFKLHHSSLTSFEIFPQKDFPCTCESFSSQINRIEG